MEREKIYYVLYEQQKLFEEEQEYVPREITQEVLSLFRLKLPIIITGVRRAGKSTLLKILAQELRLEKKDCIYINFNDERFVSFGHDDFQKVLDFAEEQGYSENCYFFIDEIQEVMHWEKWIDRIKEKHPVVITGSNSKLLSKEISTVLTGRSLSISLYPFSFREFLTARDIKQGNIKIDLKIQARVRKAFSHFVTEGGIPKAVMERDRKLLTELYENILYRDIIKRFNPRLETQIKEISVFLLSNSAKEVSIRSLSTLTEITNLATMKSILDTFEKAFLFTFIHKFDRSLRKQWQNPRKIYCIDTGFVTAVGFRTSEDKGRLLENLVLVELKRRGHEVYYFSEKAECDFVIKKGLKITNAIQVTSSMKDGAVRKREFKGLLEAMRMHKLQKGLILTEAEQETIKIEGKIIKVRPVYEWMIR